MRLFLVVILLFDSFILSSHEAPKFAKYCNHENCSIAIELLLKCDSCLIIVGPELFDYSSIETDIEKVVLKILWGSEVTNFQKITFGPLQMNYTFIREYSDFTKTTIDEMFSLDFQIDVLLRFIRLGQCFNSANTYRYYFLSQKYNSGNCYYSGCYNSSDVSSKNEWTYYEFGNYLYNRIKHKKCLYENKKNDLHPFE
jgi:hypothetical protein